MSVLAVEVDLSPLTRPQRAVYRLWMQRCCNILKDETEPLDFYGDAFPILVVTTVEFLKRMHVDVEEVPGLAEKVANFEINVQRMMRVSGRPS
jgi:hypothetical protein